MQKKAPKIGVTCWKRDFLPSNIPTLGVYENYLEALVFAGAIPILIPIISSSEIQDQYLNLIDGLLLTGGEDVSPEYYGETPSELLGDTSLERDKLEIALIKYAWGKKLPIFGICRGMQILNVALGGSLYQDIVSECKTNVVHRINNNPQSLLQILHHLDLKNDSYLTKWLNTNSLAVNSSHHQAIKDISPMLRVVGTSEDGIVEAIQAKDNRIVFGVQSHPEWQWNIGDRVWSNVFSNFVDACRNREII
jgi:putative glutamine amidotransferase